MSDLIKRLRTEPFNHWELRHEAADALEAKDERIAKLQAVVDGLDEFLAYFVRFPDDLCWDDNAVIELRQKRAALKEADGGD